MRLSFLESSISMNSAGCAPDFPTFICKEASYKFFRNTVYWWKFNSWFQTFTQKDKDRWNLGRTPSCTWDDTRGAVVSISRGWLSLEQLRNSLFSTHRTGEGSVHLPVENNFNFFGFFLSLQLRGSCSTSMKKGINKVEFRFSPEMSSMLIQREKKPKPTEVPYFAIYLSIHIRTQIQILLINRVAIICQLKL